MSNFQFGKCTVYLSLGETAVRKTDMITPVRIQLKNHKLIEMNRKVTIYKES